MFTFSGYTVFLLKTVKNREKFTLSLFVFIKSILYINERDRDIFFWEICEKSWMHTELKWCLSLAFVLCSSSFLVLAVD